MSRKVKNIITTILVIILLGVNCYIIYYANTKINNESMSIKENNNTKEAIDNQEEPKEKPDDEDRETSSITSENNNIDTTETPPDKPDEDTEGSSDIPSSSTNMEMPSTNNSTSLPTLCYILFGISSLLLTLVIIYWIMSKFYKLNHKETFKTSDKVLIYILITIIITTCITFLDSYLAKNINLNQINNLESNNTSSITTNTSATGATIVDGDEETLTENYTTSTIDESVILVENGGNATIDGATITKTDGDSSNTENSEFYGINAGILVTSSSTATIKNATISTNAKGSNAIFATGENAKIYISNSTITTTGTSSARGLDATYGGYIEADNVEITTSGTSCAALATDRGEGTIITKNSTLETNGSGSPIIYSTGSISIIDTTGVANGAQLIVVEGKNSATVTNSTLTASGAGNRGDVDQAGVMIYQSMSGDAGEGTGTFTATSSLLTIDSSSSYYETAPMFFVTNTDAAINLEKTTLTYGSGILINIAGTDEWGTSGTNGGNVTLNATSQTITGDIKIDNISTLTLNLEASSYEGTINENNTAKNIELTLDSNSTITLTKDSYVTSLTDELTDYSNINFNGYKLYVSGISIN